MSLAVTRSPRKRKPGRISPFHESSRVTPRTLAGLAPISKLRLWMRGLRAQATHGRERERGAARAGCGGSAPAQARTALDRQSHPGRRSSLPHAVRRALRAAVAVATLPALYVEQLSHAGASLAAQRGADGGRAIHTEASRFTGVLRPLSSLGSSATSRRFRHLRRFDDHGRGYRRVRLTRAHGACLTQALPPAPGPSARPRRLPRPGPVDSVQAPA